MVKRVLAAVGRVDLRGRQFIMPIELMHARAESQHELPDASDVDSIPMVVQDQDKKSKEYICIGTCCSQGEEYEVEVMLKGKQIKQCLGMAYAQACAQGTRTILRGFLVPSIFGPTSWAVVENALYFSPVG